MLFFSFCLSLKLNKALSKILNIFIIILILLNFFSFNVQKDNYIKNNLEQKLILSNFLELSNQKINSDINNVILALVPTYNNKNYNDELIFSEETGDVEYFFKLKYSKNLTVIRIYYDNKCQNILNLNQYGLVAKQPPLSRKENEFSSRLIIENVKSKNIYIYIYNKGFFKFSHENNINEKTLNNNTKCSIY